MSSVSGLISYRPGTTSSSEASFQASTDETSPDIKDLAKKIANCVQLAKNELSKMDREKPTIPLEGRMFYPNSSLRPHKLMEILQVFQNTALDLLTLKLITNDHRTLISTLILKAVLRYAHEWDMLKITHSSALERFKNCIDEQEEAEKKLTNSKTLPRNERKQFFTIASKISHDTDLARNVFSMVEKDKNELENSLKLLNSVLKTQTWLVVI